MFKLSASLDTQLGAKIILGAKMQEQKEGKKSINTSPALSLFNFELFRELPIRHQRAAVRHRVRT